MAYNFWDFSDSSQANDWLGGQWRNVPGVDGDPGIYRIITPESGQSPGTENVMRVVSPHPARAEGFASAKLWWRCYVYMEDWADGWYVTARIDALDIGGNSLHNSISSSTIPPESSEWGFLNLGEIYLPPGTVAVDLKVTFTVGSNGMSSVYTFDIDDVELIVPDPTEEPEPFLGVLVRRGFRLPYERTELKENMLFVESQLEQYLHEHAGSNVRQVGFRFPRRDFNNESAKMENARYLQTQLELYLHDHIGEEQQEVPNE